ncbi:MAG TPA: cytochrome c [Gammaproteobacteria bacterium]|nr:cytochrome c [Gammaproteobacteria bacterium]
MADPSRMGRWVGHAAVAVTLLALTACTPLDNAMVAIFGRSMRDQPSFDPYEHTLPTPEKSVPFAAANFPPAPGELNVGQPVPGGDMPPPMTQQDLLQHTPVVENFQNPVQPTDSSLARGKMLFNRYCAPCHGERGIGSEAVMAQKNPVLPAYNLAGATVQGYTDGYIYGMIREGRGLMPPYGHAVSNYDRWNIVNYVRQLQQQYNARQGGGAGGN